jgi:hypothetical protein
MQLMAAAGVCVLSVSVYCVSKCALAHHGIVQHALIVATSFDLCLGIVFALHTGRHSPVPSNSHACLFECASPDLSFCIGC